MGRKIQIVPTAPPAMESKSRTQVKASLKTDIVFLCKAMSVDRGMIAQIMNTEKEPRRPAGIANISCLSSRIKLKRTHYAIETWDEDRNGQEDKASDDLDH